MASKPCPFCGGEASARYEAFAGMAARGYRVRRDDDGCDGEVECGTHAFDTEAEAMATWNRRAECTCRMADDGPKFRMGRGARAVEWMRKHAQKRS